VFRFVTVLRPTGNASDGHRRLSSQET
jgi:hypothetical protein